MLGSFISLGRIAANRFVNPFIGANNVLEATEDPRSLTETPILLHHLIPSVQDPHFLVEILILRLPQTP